MRGWSERVTRHRARPRAGSSGGRHAVASRKACAGIVRPDGARLGHGRGWGGSWAVGATRRRVVSTPHRSCLAVSLCAHAIESSVHSPSMAWAPPFGVAPSPCVLSGARPRRLSNPPPFSATAPWPKQIGLRCHNDGRGWPGHPPPHDRCLQATSMRPASRKVRWRGAAAAMRARWAGGRTPAHHRGGSPTNPVAVARARLPSLRTKNKKNASPHPRHGETPTLLPPTTIHTHAQTHTKRVR